MLKLILLLGMSAACLDGRAVGLVIRNGWIVDGSGGAPYRGAVRVVNGEIAEVGARVAVRKGDAVVDARGMAIAPGFIDTHSHHDGGIEREREAISVTSQGVTTIIVGQDGGSHVPLADWWRSLAARPVAVNIGSYAGHGTIRGLVMGKDFRRAARAPELAKMKALLAREMAAGALGLSTGLEYDPGIYSEPSEVLALAEVSARLGGRYISHIRSEDYAFWPALDEIIHIGEVTRAPVQVSHLKLAMVSLWGKADEALRRLVAARARGIDITADVYPYEHWQSTMRVLFPKRDFESRESAEFALREVVRPDGLTVAQFDAEPSVAGRTLLQISLERHEDPVTSLIQLIRKTLQYEHVHGEANDTVIGHGMAGADVMRLLTWEHSNFCSDGAPLGSHPRAYGAFPRVFAKAVREQGLLTLAQTVRKATALAAAHVGIRDRGQLRPGYRADVVVFDPERIRDEATFQRPHALSTGIEHVFVNGVEVYRAGKATGTFPGQLVLR